jgi:hypothetical protein
MVITVASSAASTSARLGQSLDRIDLMPDAVHDAVAEG